MDVGETAAMMVMVMTPAYTSPAEVCSWVGGRFAGGVSRFLGASDMTEGGRQVN